MMSANAIKRLYRTTTLGVFNGNINLKHKPKYYKASKPLQLLTTLYIYNIHLLHITKITASLN